MVEINSSVWREGRPDGPRHPDPTAAREPLLGGAELEAAYAAAWQEWEASGDSDSWAAARRHPPPDLVTP